MTNESKWYSLIAITDGETQEGKTGRVRIVDMVIKPGVRENWEPVFKMETHDGGVVTMYKTGEGEIVFEKMRDGKLQLPAIQDENGKNEFREIVEAGLTAMGILNAEKAKVEKKS
ncbi:MAG: hypothetical protein ABSE04_02610 [Candidatus Microgenomates bacterium]|jgi:hypothetical protein